MKEKKMENEKIEELDSEEYYDMLCRNSKRVTDEINLLPISDRVKKNVDDFLDFDGIAGKKVRPYKSYFINGKAGIWIDLDNGGYCYFLFGDNDTWEWRAEAYITGKEDKIVYKKELSGEGPTDLIFTHKDGETTAYFIVYDEILKLITIPDTFTIDATPVIKFKDVYVIWETSRYDGMLSGYGLYRGEIVYFDCVDETFFEHQRLFAVYKLSILEKFMVGIRKWQWGLIMSHPLFWKCYMIKYNLKYQLGLNQTVEQSLKANEKFHNGHKVLGYFTW